ncbi:MAG: hypothetical protein KGJ66_05890 [Alphaproteobacteria bacterium]|nr:hypothetical protein [Alphaproteobacteria bacterium]
MSETDGPRYLSIASDLATTGNYTDGSSGSSQTPRPSGMYMPPLYPALLAAVVRIDPRLASTAECYSHGSGPCPNDLGILVPLQFVIAAINLLLLWRLAAVATESEAIAWVSLVLAAFGTYELAAAALSAMTENLSLCLFTAFQLALVVAVRRNALDVAVIAGILLGLTALARPAFLYVGYMIALLSLFCVLIPACRARFYGWSKLGGAIVLGASLAVLPWMLRNLMDFGTLDLTRSYAGNNLAQRVAYDAMTWHEYFAGWFFYLPDFGKSLARALFPLAWYTRLGWDPNSLYEYGLHTLTVTTVQAAGGVNHQVLYIVRAYVIPDLPKFSLVTLLLAWRGLWIGKYFSVVAFPLFVACLAVPTLRRRAPSLLLLSLPPLFMLFFQSMVSIDTIRYNIDLTASFAIGAAVCFSALGARIKAAYDTMMRR